MTSVCGVLLKRSYFLMQCRLSLLLQHPSILQNSFVLEDCLKQGRITYLVFDHVGGQVICPIEGTIREFSEKDYKFVLSRKIWHTEYLYRRVNFECPNCHHINRIYVEREFVRKGNSHSGHLTVFPMYKCQKTKHCTKCGALVAQSGLLLRIRRKQ